MNEQLKAASAREGTKYPIGEKYLVPQANGSWVHAILKEKNIKGLGHFVVDGMRGTDMVFCNVLATKPA